MRRFLARPPGGVLASCAGATSIWHPRYSDPSAGTTAGQARGGRSGVSPRFAVACGLMVEFLTAGQQVPGARSTYTVERKLGEGGFGVAFLAIDAEGRAVVLKQLQVARLEAWKAMELFEREARVLASATTRTSRAATSSFAADGEHAVRASDVTELGAAASLVLVQDHVEGASLEAHRRGRALDRGGARGDVADNACARLSAYLASAGDSPRHQAGEHRRHAGGGADAGRLRGLAGPHASGVGTPARRASAPLAIPMEQVLGKARPASDLYALGMTMMVALTHRAPEDLPARPRHQQGARGLGGAGPGRPVSRGCWTPCSSPRLACGSPARRMPCGRSTARPSSRRRRLCRRRGAGRCTRFEWWLPLWGGGLGPRWSTRSSSIRGRRP